MKMKCISACTFGLMFAACFAASAKAGTFIANETNRNVRVAYVWAYDGDGSADANAYFSKFHYLRPGQSFEIDASFMKTQAIWLVYHFETSPGSGKWERAIPDNYSGFFSGSGNFKQGKVYRTTCYFDPSSQGMRLANEFVIRNMRNGDDFDALKSYVRNGSTWRCVRISPYYAHGRAPGATLRILKNGTLGLRTW